MTFFLSAFWVIQAQPILESHKVHKKTAQLPGQTLIPSGHNSVNQKKKKNHKPGWPSCITPESPHLHVCPSTWTMDDRRQKRNALGLPRRPKESEHTCLPDVCFPQHEKLQPAARPSTEKGVYNETTKTNEQAGQWQWICRVPSKVKDKHYKPIFTTHNPCTLGKALNVSGPWGHPLIECTSTDTYNFPFSRCIIG